jgi:hypothetical protein
MQPVGRFGHIIRSTLFSASRSGKGAAMRRVRVLVPALVVACSAAFSAQVESRTLDIY